MNIPFEQCPNLHDELKPFAPHVGDLGDVGLA